MFFALKRVPNPYDLKPVSIDPKKTAQFVNYIKDRKAMIPSLTLFKKLDPKSPYPISPKPKAPTLGFYFNVVQSPQMPSRALKRRPEVKLSS